MDRTYWQFPNLAWHADRPAGVRSRIVWALCGLSYLKDNADTLRRADRLPPTAHLCGNCSRIIAARTDIEEERRDFKRGELARVADLQEAAIRRFEDVPEHVASEQDDSGVPI